MGYIRDIIKRYIKFYINQSWNNKVNNKMYYTIIEFRLCMHLY